MAKNAPGNIFLIGPRGCGKTTVGHILAARLQYAFTDTDHVFTQKVGLDIASYIAAYGWAAFRSLESDILLEVCRGDGQVVGTGGGIVLDAGNRRQMTRAGLVVYLKGRPETLVRRLTLDPKEAQRPALTVLDPGREIFQICAEREPLYLSCAHFVVDAEQSPEQSADEIYGKCRGRADQR